MRTCTAWSFATPYLPRGRRVDSAPSTMTRQAVVLFVTQPVPSRGICRPQASGDCSRSRGTGYSDGKRWQMARFIGPLRAKKQVCVAQSGGPSPSHPSSTSRVQSPSLFRSLRMRMRPVTWTDRPVGAVWSLFNRGNGRGDDGFSDRRLDADVTPDLAHALAHFGESHAGQFIRSCDPRSTL
jgi:hypothetical protein